jgi:hypothetical protein
MGAEDDYGICLQTRLVRALDIDVSDPGEAEAIADVIEDFGLPCRKRSNSPKRLFVFACPATCPNALSAARAAWSRLL